jgi:hypothetical protein
MLLILMNAVEFRRSEVAARAAELSPVVRDLQARGYSKTGAVDQSVSWVQELVAFI